MDCSCSLDVLVLKLVKQEVTKKKWPSKVREVIQISVFEDLGKHCNKKNGKKGDMVPIQRPPSPPKQVKRGHLLSKKARKSRQMRFRNKTAYVRGLGYN